jgi:L,D-peptidoglycan transpeptidase YkuD (ErfK/YbiS/YcfS/YnhG family)
MKIIVQANKLYLGDKVFPCAIGRSGISANKKEGDGATPAGKFPLREVFYRSDRVNKPNCKLPMRAIEPNYAWCDDDNDPKYNQLIILPDKREHRATEQKEGLWREDHLYDLIVVIGYNDEPIVKGLGSAIFMHVARSDYSPTAGCVALALNDLLYVVECLAEKTNLLIES